MTTAFGKRQNVCLLPKYSKFDCCNVIHVPLFVSYQFQQMLQDITELLVQQGTDLQHINYNNQNLDVV